VITLAPKAKLQQVMMTVAQEAAFRADPHRRPRRRFHRRSRGVRSAGGGRLAESRDSTRASCCCSAAGNRPRAAAGCVIPMVAARLGIEDCFLAVDELKIEDGALVDQGSASKAVCHQVSRCAGPPAALAWATGNLPEPANHPQTGMANMRAMMPALQRAKAAGLKGEGFAVTEAAPAGPAAARRKSSKISPPRRSPAICSNGIKGLRR